MIRNHSKHPIHAVHSTLILSMIRGGDVFYQAIGKWSFLYMAYDYFRGRRIILYFHEPYSLQERLKGLSKLYHKGRSFSEHIYFKIILTFTHKIIVDNENALLRFYEFSGFKIEDVHVAGLLFPKPKKYFKNQKINSSLLLGRIDENRNLKDYIEIADKLNLIPSLATSQPIKESYHIKILNEGRRFKEKEKFKWYSCSKYIYSFFQNRYNQSGVVKEALVRHKEVIINRHDSHVVPVRLFGLGIIVTKSEDGFLFSDVPSHTNWSEFDKYLIKEIDLWEKALL